MPKIDHTINAARKKLGAPEAWKWCRLEAVGDCVIVTGGIPVGEYKSGKRKGMSKWGDTERVIVSDAESAAEQKLYEETTGNCGECMGEGNRIESSSVLNGNTYKPCKDCNGTGKHA